MYDNIVYNNTNCIVELNIDNIAINESYKNIISIIQYNESDVIDLDKNIKYYIVENTENINIYKLKYEALIHYKFNITIILQKKNKILMSI